MTENTRRVRIVTDHDTPAAASRIAAAIRPDNTDEMTTTVEGSTVETAIERPTTGGLRATADDYVVNLRVAAQLDDQDGAPSTDTHDT